jgi:adhesin isopeptide-forming family sspB-C2 type protein
MGFNLKHSARETGSDHPGLARKKGWRALVAGVAALATLAAPAVAMADAGGGTGSDGGGGTGGTASIHWLTKDAWPATNDGVRQALGDMGYPITGGGTAGTANDVINTSLGQAINQCQASYTGEGAADCRLVGVGIVGNDDSHTFTGISNWADSGLWHQKWNDEVAGKTYNYNGVNWNANTAWTDKRGNHTLSTLADEVITANLGASLRVIVLAKNQPAPPTYSLTVATQASAAPKAGSNDPVHDTVTLDRSGSSVAENVTVSTHLKYDGSAAGIVPGAEANRDKAMPNQGATGSDDFTPKDFGMANGWVPGHYCFSAQVAKQGHMGAAVNTPACAAGEDFTVTDVPPAPPAKSIDKGVSASQMVNRTVITSKTGLFGYAMAFSDQITPNGVKYTVGNYKLVDKDDGNKDVSADFAITWDKKANTVSATRNQPYKSFLPSDHSYEFSFDVTVSKPDVNKVKDIAKVTWNEHPAASTDEHEFPTWTPAPDKSWVKLGADGKWQTVVDPGRTNATGADNNVFLDEDRVASVVNGTVDANLIQAPTKLALADDWTASDYLVDPEPASSIRVYEANGQSDANGHYVSASVNDIATKGKDVTSQFKIALNGSKASATAKPAYLAKLKGLKTPLQVTLLVPMTVNFANGKGAAQVRADHGKQPGDELEFCDANSTRFTNSGSESVNDVTTPTNVPAICGYVPPVKKDVIGEASQGGNQASVDGKVVFPGQRVEYQLLTTPKLPDTLAYGVRNLVLTDTYDQYLQPDKQTLELMDLNTGKVIPKSAYATKWDDAKHLAQATISDQALLAGWKAGGNPRIQLRFEGTVSKSAPTDHKVDNQWMLTLNNSLTPSNVVFNVPPAFTPVKTDTQGSRQGDPTISIDGRTLMLGDTGTYTVTLDAKQQNQAYDVWKLGIVDDFDEQYVSIDQSKIAVLGADGKDYTSRFNIKVIDGVVYAFARTVDTKVPATGATVKGDPQPADLAAYAKSDKHDALKSPAIDQSLLGQTYQLVMPYTVIKVTKGYVVKNTATQVVNDMRKATNQVSNPLAPINPVKDVTIKVGGASINGQSVWLNSTFLYQLDSSLIPASRAYPTVDRWDITDQLNSKVDQYTGQWAVYAQTDLYKDGQVLADKGSKIAGSGFDSSAFGSDLFTAQQDANGVVTVSATSAYKALVSADNAHEAGWRAYIQCTRIAVTERQDNQFTEHYNDKVLPSNVVWTRTPQLTPSIHIVKWDEKSGLPKGDRNDPKDALTVSGDTTIVFTITNTSNDPEGHGAVFQAKDLKLEDHTIAGDGTVTDLKYPANWDTLVLKPGDHVDVTGTLRGVTTVHTDRAKVTGTPLFECPASDQNPFGNGKAGEPVPPRNAVHVDGRTLCSDTPVTSNQDDWNGKVPTKLEQLAQTGAPIAGVVLVVVALAGGAAVMLVTRRRHAAHAAASMEAGSEDSAE